MRQHSLTENKGLSLSQAQSISNLCNQRAIEIDNMINNVNNFSKFVTIDGNPHIIQKERKLPTNVVELIIEKSKLHACQAFLMENIKAKEQLLRDNKNSRIDLSYIVKPEKPTYTEIVDIDDVDEQYGWSQLSTTELNEYIEAEAYASHIGQYIHKKSVLDKLRSELPNVPDIEWMEINNGVKSPVYISTHHTSEGLLELHNKLAALHRQYEQRVNYFKAKVKNIVTEKNSEIAIYRSEVHSKAHAENERLNAEYEQRIRRYETEIDSLLNEYEQLRHKNTKKISSMRITVDPRFQETINKFLVNVEEDK
jgi:hypothetical protein